MRICMFLLYLLEFRNICIKSDKEVKHANVKENLVIKGGGNSQLLIIFRFLLKDNYY